MPPTGSPSRRFSLAGRLLAATAAVIALHTSLIVLGLRHELPPVTVTLLASAVSLGIAAWLIGRAVQPLGSTLAMLSDGIRSFSDRDFSVRLSSARPDELGDLIRLYNDVGRILHAERAQIRQRELLLQTALEQSPVGIVLVDGRRRITYANTEARRLLVGGGRLVGDAFDAIVARCPESMQQALDDDADGIFTVEAEGEIETYHVAHRAFTLNRRPHSLYLLRRMTAELGRREATIWKRVIRILSHELNNSLAPISSLAHSGRTLARQGGSVDKQEHVYRSIRERVDHLGAFLEGYARYARLPRPVKRRVAWSELLGEAQAVYPFTLASDVPSQSAWCDPAQMQQVLINLLKNAVEASPPDAEIQVRVDPLPDGGWRLQVLDRGRGMDDEVLRQALLPFYSTKPSGSGVGLPLCREIVDAHGGSLRLQNRAEGGLAVSLWLPSPPEPDDESPTAHA